MIIKINSYYLVTQLLLLLYYYTLHSGFLIGYAILECVAIIILCCVNVLLYAVTKSDGKFSVSVNSSVSDISSKIDASTPLSVLKTVPFLIIDFVAFGYLISVHEFLIASLIVILHCLASISVKMSVRLMYVNILKNKKV